MNDIFSLYLIIGAVVGFMYHLVDADNAIQMFNPLKLLAAMIIFSIVWPVVIIRT